VGRVAFKRRVTPLDGNHVFALPSCIASFHLSSPGWGALASLSSCCRWRNATSRKLVPFSHRSASRIFIILAGMEGGLSRSSTSRTGSWVTLSFSIQGRGCSLA
jgi:hypothetical protein